MSDTLQNQIITIPAGCLGNTEISLPCKSAGDVVFYHFSMVECLKPEIYIIAVSAKPSDNKIVIDEITISDSRQDFSVRIGGGETNVKFGIRFEVLINTNEKKEFDATLPIVPAGIIDKGPVGCYALGNTGPQGDTGAQGEKGDTGAQGEKGDTGAQGEKGDTGAQGEKGDTGAQGIKGDTGAQGVKGDTGAQGKKGAIGESYINDGTVDLNVKTITSDKGKIKTDGNGALSVNEIKSNSDKFNLSDNGIVLSGPIITDSALTLGNSKNIPDGQYSNGSVALNDEGKPCLYNEKTQEWEDLLSYNNNVSYIQFGTPLSTENIQSEQVKNAKVDDIIIAIDTQDHWQKVENEDNTTTWKLRVSPLSKMLSNTASGTITGIEVENQRGVDISMDMSLQNLYQIATGTKGAWMGGDRDGKLSSLVREAKVNDLEEASGYTFTWSSNAIGETYFFENIMGTFIFRVCGLDLPETGLAIRAKIMCENEDKSDPEHWEWAYKDQTFILRMGG